MIASRERSNPALGVDPDAPPVGGDVGRGRFHLILDGSLPYEGPALRDRCIRIFDAYGRRLIGVICDPDVLSRREHDRPDRRPEGLAVRQAHDIHDGKHGTVGRFVSVSCQRRRVRLPTVERMTQTYSPRRVFEQSPALGAVAIGVLTLAAAVATSTSYVLQPELPTVAADIGSSLSVVGVVAGLPIAGYLLGLALLVPLADRLRSNRLIACHLVVLGGGLSLAAVAPGPVLLGLGLFVSGLCASTGAQMSSLAGRYAEASRRGRAVGTVTAGISAGIVLGRILGGALADWFGWRMMLVDFAALCVLLGLVALIALPRYELTPPQGYLAVVRSLPRLVWTNRALRLAASSGALWFFSFSLVWVGLSIALARPPLSLSPGTIGLYSLAGLLGVFATRIAGRLADRFGSPTVVLSGLLLAGTCTLVMGFSLGAPPLLLVGLALFDAGLFAAQVANQSRVLSLDPARPAQFNSAYMVVYFVGGTAGTAVGGVLVAFAGWPGVALAGTLAIAVAIPIALLTGRTPDRDVQPAS